MSKKIGIIMGSTSDLQVMSEAAKLLKEFAIDFEIQVVSAHRTPQLMYDYCQSYGDRGIGIIIAGAGGSAHLPGMVAAMTDIPVIGVPVQSRSLNGLDSLLSIVQMPPGIPVATVAINGSKNAAILAAKMLGITNPDIREKIKNYRLNLEETVLKNSEIDLNTI
jgi:5-(carboxyamino)imidazole ribonucleotide mutase